MPTGYTGPALENNWTLRQYAERCARGLGAFAAYRDEPMDIPLPKKAPDWKYDSMDFYEKELELAEEEFKKLSKMSEKEQAEYGENKKIKTLKYNRERLEKNQKELFYYKNLLRQVEEYFSPPKELEAWKGFMIQQLELTIDHDDSTSFIKSAIKEMEERTPQEIFDGDLKSAKERIERYKRKVMEEKERKENEPGTQYYIDLIHETLARYE